MTDLHLAVDRGAGGLAGQVARELRDAIRSGRLALGTRLPPSRDLAKDLGLSRGAVVEAYEQLVAEGFLAARTGAGTYVAAGPRTGGPSAGGGGGVAAAAATSPVTFPATSPMTSAMTSPVTAPVTWGLSERDRDRPTSPDLGAFPRQAWMAAVRHVLTTLPNDALDYGDPGGVPDLREELAPYLRRVRAADAAPEHLVVVTGVAQGLSLTIQALAASRGRGIVLAVEDPTSPHQLPLLQRAGAGLVRVPVDEEGIVVERLAETKADAVLLTPAHQYPTGVVLSPRRRAEVMAWAAGTGAIVLEDDYDAEFRFDRDPVGCLQGLAPDRVVLVGSVSKSLAPGMRLGWVVAPPHIATSVRLARAELDLGSPVIDQYALAHLIRTGRYDRHLRRMRREYRARRDALVSALAEHLPAIAVQGVSAGLHLYARLPEGWDEVALAAAARAAGLAAEAVVPAHRRPGLVIGFARVPPHRITRAVRDLADGVT
ncbi:PLP-dependent aminotransferase family protein [Planotetraspora sp. A-T 1434]|uniref:MocR-like pyridoxine biosynthesis transcription factor PdxR n=1 Tax=Planotetraspora sp. A-T 1434 TaxID=2979219 RepID=UPI0021C1123B|nr:PLP-dependent aminotransferase family protein [Planotetraspora sp. A-T 1434]MCT9932689.1 PLP-dependent aminotransferase family protein [Planotetraspora sp. A-T 1434]